MPDMHDEWRAMLERLRTAFVAALVVFVFGLPWLFANALAAVSR